MRHDETRDNTTAIESNLTAADAYADTREMTPVDMDNPAEGVFDAVVVREERHEERNDGANGYDPEDPEHDPIGDAETEYDIEYEEALGYDGDYYESGIDF